MVTVLLEYLASRKDDDDFNTLWRAIPSRGIVCSNREYSALRAQASPKQDP